MHSLIDIVSIKAAFVSAAYYKIHPILIRYTVEFRGGILYAQIVVLKSATELELDDIMDILGGIVGEFATLTADFEMVKLSSIEDINNILPLEIKLFQRALTAQFPG